MLKDHRELQLCMEDTEWPKEYIDHDRAIARAIVFDDEGYFYFLRVMLFKKISTYQNVLKIFPVMRFLHFLLYKPR